jgi:uncharacterized FlaG/YvyC family protein
MAINRVGKVGQMDFGAGPVQVEAPSPAEAPEPAEAAPQAKQADQKTSDTASAPVLNGDVRLKFIVDSKTNDVTVLVLDKTSRQIIRTIPTDELKNLTHGDLVTIFA